MSSPSNPGAEIITRLGKNNMPGREVRAGTGDGALSIVQLDAVANLARSQQGRDQTRRGEKMRNDVIVAM